MSLLKNPMIALRSLLAFVLALAMLPLLNLAGGELADWSGWLPQGQRRLAWDLGWVFLSGIVATWLVVRLAPAAPRGHALALFAVMAAIGLLAVYQLGADWPRWFSAGILLGLPQQLWLGLWLGMRGRKAGP